MDIRNIRHKGLKNFVEKNQSKGLSANFVEKIRDIVTFLAETESIEEVAGLQKYKPHMLSGDWADTYSLHVTANWRITFKYDETEQQIYDVDFEDYH